MHIILIQLISGNLLAGLDFKNLYEMSEVLSQAGLPTDAIFTIREHFNTAPGAKSLAEVYKYLCTCTFCMLLYVRLHHIERVMYSTII